MIPDAKKADYIDSFFKILVFGIIATGIAVRIAVFLQNRNLFIDEANIARNIYERNFFQLALPLGYEQYAPPVFLWSLKLFTGIFGYGEMAFRLFPLLAGIGSFIVMFYLLKEIISYRSMWYPLALMAVAYLLIRYSTELKQYISDILVILSLMLLALKQDIFKTGKMKFLVLWMIAGTVAIWSAMPSVFILAGVGFYYLAEVLKRKEYEKIYILLVMGGFWIAQFVFYYFAILHPQIDSNYLQNFHQEFFLFATPESKEEWLHNGRVINALIKEAGGFNQTGVYFHIALILSGSILFFKKSLSRGILFVLPLMLVLLAAALNQFSLIPRVALFTMPLFLLLAGYGLDRLMTIRFWPVPVAVFLFCAKKVYDHSSVNMAWNRTETEEITDAMQFVIQKGIHSGEDLYIHNGARPAFIYYTQMHPDSSRWAKIKNARLLMWDADYESIAQSARDTTGFILTSVYPEELERTQAIFRNHLKEAARLEKPGCHAFIFTKKNNRISLQKTAGTF